MGFCQQLVLSVEMSRKSRGPTGKQSRVVLLHILKGVKAFKLPQTTSSKGLTWKANLTLSSQRLSWSTSCGRINSSVTDYCPVLHCSILHLLSADSNQFRLSSTTWWWTQCPGSLDRKQLLYSYYSDVFLPVHTPLKLMYSFLFVSLVRTLHTQYLMLLSGGDTQVWFINQQEDLRADRWWLCYRELQAALS